MIIVINNNYGRSAGYMKSRGSRCTTCIGAFTCFCVALYIAIILAIKAAHNSDPPRLSWVVLLTMCFDRPTVESVAEHTNIYRDVLDRWLTETGIHIFVVETSGYSLNLVHPRLTYLTFDDTSRHTVTSSSVLEANALVFAAKEMQSYAAFKNASHVLKVTGRYFLEDIETKLHLLSKKPVKALYLQNHRNGKISWQNSEYFGIMKEALAFPALHVHHTRKSMEESLFALSKIVYSGVFGVGFRNTQARGGDGLIVNPL